jgi:glutathione S-transferase
VRFTVLDIWRHVHDKDKEYFRQSREKRIGTTLEAFTADRAERLEGFRRDLAPLRQVFQAQPFLGGERPLYADYIVFGAFQWARCVSEFQLLKSDDPVAQWRGRMLGLYDGLAGKAVGYPV